MRNTPRILFHTHSSRAVASSLIGHLYEVAQRFPVVVLTESLPENYSAAIADRRLFPQIECVREVRTVGVSPGDVVRRNREWWRLAGCVLDEYRPTLVVAENDFAGLFEMYLLRQARLRGIRRITLQSMGQLREAAARRVIAAQRVYADGAAPGSLCRAWRQIGRAAGKRAVDAVVHYALPWVVGQPALRGGSSYIRLTGAPGMRDSQLHVVQTPQQHQTCVENGVDAARLAILPHPAGRVPYDVFFPLARRETPASARPAVLVLLSSLHVGIERGTGRVIPPADRRRTRLDAVRTIAARLPGWQVLIKAHPIFGTVEEVEAYLGESRAAVDVLDPARPVEEWLPFASAVIDLAPANTTSLATAAAGFPNLPVIAADLDADLTGDQYADWPAISYVQTQDAFEALLDRIKDVGSPGTELEFAL